MKKKDKTPFILRLVRWSFPKLELLSPALANRLSIKLFFTPLKYTPPDKEKEIGAKANTYFIEVGGRKIQIYTWGAGPVVLLAHGWAGRGTQFRKIIPALEAEGFMAVSFDGPAHGNSEGRMTNISEFAAVMDALVKKAGKPKAIIAHSFGGVASLYAIMNGLAVDKLINIASPTIADDIINNYQRAMNASVATGAAFKSYIKKSTGKSFEEFSALYSVAHLPHPLDLLLIHDEKDLDVTMKHPEAMMKTYPSAHLLKTTGLGHSRILRDEKVIATCIQFIQGKAPVTSLLS